MMDEGEDGLEPRFKRLPRLVGSPLIRLRDHPPFHSPVLD